MARRYHLHTPGIVYTVISILIVLGAINGQNNLLFWAFGLAVSGMLISGFLSGAALMGVRIRREALFPTDAGSPLLVRYTIRNTNRLIPAFALTIEELEATRRRGASRATWFRFMPRPSAYVPHLAPRGTLVVDTVVTPWARGKAMFEAFRVSTTFPFGLTFKSVVFVQVEDVAIRPWRPELMPRALRRVLAAAGHADRSVQRRGVGEETYALRDYRAGDSTRVIAWKPTARLSRFIVREAAQRSPASVCVAVGNASSPQSLERIVSLVASIASRASGEGLEVGVHWPDAALSIAPSAGPATGSRILDALALAQPGGGDATASGLSAFDRSTKIVIHEGASAAPAAGLVLSLSVNDPMLTDPSAWLRQPAPPEATHAPATPQSMWSRLARLLGGLG